MLQQLVKVLPVFCLFTACLRADAAVIYSIGFDQASYNVTAGSTFDVKVIFRETVTDLDPAKLAVGAGDGLFSAGVKLNYGVVTGGTSGATVNNVTLNDAVGFFDDTGVNINIFDNSPRTADLFGQSVNAADGIEVADFPALSGVYSIELAIISFTSSIVDGETTFLSLSDLDSGLLDSVLADATELDNILIFGNAMIVNAGTAAVPEPSTSFALGAGILAYWFRRRGRRA